MFLDTQYMCITGQFLCIHITQTFSEKKITQFYFLLGIYFFVKYTKYIFKNKNFVGSARVYSQIQL